jgi:hypothetical protein
MTAPRRSLLLAAAAAFLFPACISIHAKSTPLTPPDVAAQLNAQTAAFAGVHGAASALQTTQMTRKTDFAIYPARPGEVVAIKPAAKDATTAQKPAVGNAGAHMPIAPPPPGGVITADHPGPFPLAPVRSAVLAEPPLLAAVRAYIEGKPERAIEFITALDKPNQEFVLAILPALARGATADLASDPVAVAVLVDQLRSAAKHLEPRAALRVDAVAFCRTVYGFGRYDPWPENQPYRPNDQAQLYLEVRNLVSQPAVGPRGETFLTHARAVVEVRNAYGKIEPQPDPADWRRRVDVVQFEKKLYTRAPVQDFHVLYAFPVPPAPGVYTVTVELRDAAGRRVVRTAPTEFRVAGP